MPQIQDGRMQIACASDARYFRHCATMLASLTTFNRNVHVHVLCTADVPEEDRVRLTQWGSERGAIIECVTPQIALPERMPGRTLPRLTQGAWLRLLLPDMMQTLSRVLYLDVDLIVQDSLAELWQIDLQGKWVAAVNDIPAVLDPQSAYQRVGFERPEEYFNSGVLLMDLDAFRRERIGQRCLDYVAEHPEQIILADQDPLNALLHDHRRSLPLRWNVTAHIHEGGASHLPFPKDQLEDALARPAIIHFSGDWKPWHVRSRHPLRQLYADYRKQTPWPHWTLDGRSLKHRLLRLMSVRMQRKLTEMYWSTRDAIGLGPQK